MVSSVPFTEATDVGVAILNSFPFCGDILAAIFPYLISNDLLIWVPDLFPDTVKSELPSIFTTDLSSRYMIATNPFFPVNILSLSLSGVPGFKGCLTELASSITETFPFTLIARAILDEAEEIEHKDKQRIRIRFILKPPQK
jgi:hypothetical protein